MKQQIRLSDHFTYRKLLQFVFPSIVMMIFTSIYGVVDGLFVSNFAGKTAFAAINLVMPFIMVLGGIGFMIGTGGTALVSKTLGEGRQEEANRYFSMMILFTALLGVLLSVTGVVFMRPVALFLGATPEMLEDCVRYGRIVNLSSVVGLRGNAGQTNYSASKAGLIGLTKSLAKELASRNVTVNAVAPGFIATDMTAALPEAVRTEMCKTIPEGRAGQPEDVANAVAFFAAEQSSYLTGQVLCVDGGMAM